MLEMIAASGCGAIALPAREGTADAAPAQDALEVRKVLEGKGCDWLVMDHYDLDAQWSSQLRSSTRRIMVIDDLANRRHDCDVLLDQNYYRNMEHRYDTLVPSACRMLLGPRFALLRKQFRDARATLRARDGQVRRMLIFMGGSDSVNATSKAVRAVRAIGEPVGLDVVIGGTNPHCAQVQALCASLPDARLHVQVENMAALMAGADLAIGAGGAATWERCSLGLPALTLVFAQNQLQTTLDLADLGVIRYLGWVHECTEDDMAQAIRAAMQAPQALREMSARAMALMEGATSSPFSFAAELALTA